MNRFAAATLVLCGTLGVTMFGALFVGGVIALFTEDGYGKVFALFMTPVMLFATFAFGAFAWDGVQLWREES